MEPLKEKIKKPKKLSRKAKIFIKEMKEHGNGTKAALVAYDTTDENVAAVIASENIRKPQIAAKLADSISDELVSQRIHDLLNKKETVEIYDKETGEKYLERTEEIHVGAVSKGVEFAARMKGVYNPEIIPIPVKGNTYNFFNNVEIKATTNEYEQKLKEVLYKEKKD